MVRARLPAKPLFSVSGREPRVGNFGNSGPAARMVRARLPSKPLFFVSGREPRAEEFGNGGSGAGMVRARLPSKPLFFVSGREPRAEEFGNGGPGPAPVCAPLLARPYTFVSGSKIFTQTPAGMCCFAGDRAGRFAPRSPLGLVASFRGAKSSHNSRPENAVSPAAGLLPAPC